MDRIQYSSVKNDLEEKIVLLSGPRQVGKTTLAQLMFPESTHYLNYDQVLDRKVLREQGWRRDVDLVIFDEIHKMPRWKSWVKGVYDHEGVRPRLLVTGSARMDVYFKGGDSLAGRHFSHRLLPLSVAEVIRGGFSARSDEALENLIRFGGFPEPYMKGTEVFANRWRKSHLDRIIREDLLDLEKVRELKKIELLTDLLAERVSSTVSFLSLARDLEVSPNTIKHWIEILERLFVIFVVTPYSKNLARALLKEPKIYFYDIGRVMAGDAARLENAIALSLLKRNHFLEDTRGDTRALHYLRDTEKREVDFVTLNKKKAEYLIEVKSSDGALSPSLNYFSQRVPHEQAIQLVMNLKREGDLSGVKIRRAADWLSKLEV